MKIDFFEIECKEAIRMDTEFGICDDDDKKAYTTIKADENNWIATIKNELKVPVTFPAIDNCLAITKKGTNDLESTCDGMLTFVKSLYLIELKDKKKKWISEAIGQIENTIKIMLENKHDLTQITYKKAFICNKKRKYPRFNETTNARDKQFFDKWGFMLKVQATIKIK